MRGFSVLLLTAFCFVPDAISWAASPTYLDLAPRDAWRYFYSDGTAAESDTIIDTALTDSGFYDNWTLPEFDEPDVLSISWQDGSVPIGFGFPPDEIEFATELPAPISGRNRTLFLRQTFDVPADITGPMAIDLTAVGATVYIDGVEMLRENCCLTESVPTVGRPGFLDESSQVRTITGLYAIDNLAPGPHTIAASAHPSGPSYDSQVFDLRLFSPISEKPWSGGGENENWVNEDNWYFGVPGPTDFAVFRRESRANAQLDTPVTLSGIQLETASYTGHTIMGNGEIRLQGDGGGNGGLNATGGHHTLAVDVRLDSDVDAQIQSSIIDIEGSLNLNGHTLSMTGDGLMAVMSHNVSGSGTIRVEGGTLSGKGTISGDVTTSDGWINAGDETERFSRRSHGTLTITGDATGRVELDLYTVDEFDILAGGNNGVANVERLKVTADRLETYDGATFQLFTDWPTLSIGEVDLPDIGSAEWDTSRLQEGILIVSNTDPDPCDFNASGFCTVADLDLLTIDVVEGNNDLRFDMNGDLSVDRQDVDIWLLEAALLNGFESAYLPGDANLDGSVNASDLMVVGLNWRSSIAGWSNADFILDGVVDTRDLNELGKNWQKTLSSSTNAVPEPMSFLLMFFALGFLFQFGRRLRGRILSTLMLTISFFVFKV